MYKNILIISSNNTGHGHKSITTALTEQLSTYEDVKFNIIDGFALNGNLGLKVAKLYGTITRTSKDLWKLIWEISFKKPNIIIDVTEATFGHRFLRLISSLKPDAIISTHPNYVSSVINVLEKAGLNIPFFPVVADPVTISPLWADSRAIFTICPTDEAKQACIALGVPEEKIKVFGFPLRSRFTAHIDMGSLSADYDFTRPLNFTVMSGGEGSGNMARIARTLAKNFDCRIRLICGRNKNLKRTLEYTLPEKYRKKVEILGFISDIENIMLDSDILITRASPNTMLEAVMCNVPLIVTGALPGQEEGNPAYIQNHNLGVVCGSVKNMKNTVSSLIENNAAKLNEIKKNQRDYRDPETAKKIVDFILNN